AGGGTRSESSSTTRAERAPGRSVEALQDGDQLPQHDGENEEEAKPKKPTADGLSGRGMLGRPSCRADSSDAERNADDQNDNADERIEPRCPGVEDLTQAGDASQDEKTADAPPECALHGPCPRSKRVHAYVSLPPRGLLFSGIHTREPRANAC